MDSVIEGSYVCDLSGCGVLRIAGAGAARFVSTMFSGALKPLESLGGFSQGVVLTGQGEVIDLVNVMRTGDDEYLMMTSADNRQETFEWLSAHSELTDDDGAVFGDVSLEDDSEKMAVLLMFGSTVSRNLEQLEQAAGGTLPALVHSFDAACYGVPAAPAYLLFAPRAFAAQMGEFLLQDPELNVEYPEELERRLDEAGQYCAALHDAAYANPLECGLGAYLRPEGDFVGASALAR